MITELPIKLTPNKLIRIIAILTYIQRMNVVQLLFALSIPNIFLPTCKEIVPQFQIQTDEWSKARTEELSFSSKLQTDASQRGLFFAVARGADTIDRHCVRTEKDGGQSVPIVLMGLQHSGRMRSSWQGLITT